MRIRRVSGKDLPAIVAIFNQAILAQQVANLEPITAEEWRSWFERHPQEKYPILVAETAGEVVGWLSISDYRPGRRALRFTAEVSYFVDHGHRRTGVATALMRAAIERCPELEIKTLIAILLDDNEASLGFLERFGFAEWGRLPNTVDFDGRELAHVYWGRRVAD